MSDTFVPPRRQRPIPITELPEFMLYDDPKKDLKYFVEIGKWVDDKGRQTFECNVIATKACIADNRFLDAQES